MYWQVNVCPETHLNALGITLHMGSADGEDACRAAVGEDSGSLQILPVVRADTVSGLMLSGPSRVG